MPVAVVNLEEVEHFDLKSAPPDGFVDLKRMTYGQIVARRSMTKLAVEAKKGAKSFMGELAMANTEVSMFEFKTCIVDHNLEDVDGKKLNLAGPVDFARLDPRVGQEIEKHIADMHDFENDEEGN